MRRLFIGIFLTIFLILSLLYFAVNSSFFLKKIADIYLPKYNLSYSKISGNAISGVKIENIAFEDKRVLNSLTIKLNPYKLLFGTISISKLKILNLDINQTLNFSKSLKQSSSSSKSYFPFEIKVSNIELSTLPFSKAGVYVSKESLTIDTLFLDKSGFRVDNLKESLVSSAGKLFFVADFRDKTLLIDKLNLVDIDLDSILKLTKKGDTKKDNSVAAPLKSIKLKELFISTKPFKKKISFNKIKAIGKDIDINFLQKTLLIKSFAGLIDSDIAKAKFILSSNSRVLNFKKIELSQVDIKKVIGLLNSKKPRAKNSQSNSSNKFIPRDIFISSLKVDSKGYKLKNFKLQKAKLIGKSILLSSFKAQKGDLALNLDSNFLKGEIVAKIKPKEIVIDEKYSRLKLKSKLFKEYKIPIKSNSLSKIVLKGVISKENIKVYGGFLGKNILDKNYPKTDIKKAIFRVLKNKNGFFLDLNFAFSSEIAKYIKLIAKVDLNKLSYKAKIKIDKVSLKNKALKDIKIDIDGDKDRVFATLDAKEITAKLLSKDLKNLQATIKSKKRVYLKDYVTLPKELSNASLKLSSKLSINLSSLNIDGKFKLLSNLVDITGSIKKRDSLKLNYLVKVPKNTILNRFNPNLKLQSLNRLKGTLSLKDKTLFVSLKNRLLKLKLNKKRELLNGALSLNKSLIKFSGSTKDTIDIKLSSSSLSSLLKDVSLVYNFSPPKVNGHLNIKAKISKLQKIDLYISSDYIQITSPTKEKRFIKDLKAYFSKDKESIYLDRYSFKFNKIEIKNKKRSIITLKGNNILIKELWVNDSLKVTGKYNLKLKKGKLQAKSKSFSLNTKDATLKLSPNITVVLNKNKIDIDGKVVILGGVIKYKLVGKSYSSDSDIVIIQHQKRDKNSKSLIKIYILINSKKPILFKNQELNIKFLPNLSISKEYKDKNIKFLGSIDILKGGYYKFENKKFILQKSAIYFTSNPTNPLLNIHLKLQRYNKIIKIYVAGSASEPSLNFSSQPPMTREQILSYILFDDENAIESSNMVSALGGALAKSILKNIGIKIDSMVIKSDGFEIGKKISKKVTIVYDQSNEPKAILRIEHSKKFETDISVGESSQSVDITYKKEF